MPPWKPHSGAGVFREAPRLSPVEKEILQAWAATGRTQGDPNDLPPLPEFHDGWQLGEPDIVIAMPQPFTVPRPDATFIRPLPCRWTLVAMSSSTASSFVPVTHVSCTIAGSTSMRPAMPGSCDLADPLPGFYGPRQSQGIGELPYPGLGGWIPA